MKSSTPRSRRQQADQFSPVTAQEVDVGPAREGGAAAQARAASSRSSARGQSQLRQHNGVRDAGSPSSDRRSVRPPASTCRRTTLRAVSGRMRRSAAMRLPVTSPAWASRCAAPALMQGRGRGGGRGSARPLPHLGSRPVAVIKACGSRRPARAARAPSARLRRRKNVPGTAPHSRCSIALPARWSHREFSGSTKVVSAPQYFQEVHGTTSLIQISMLKFLHFIKL